MEIVSQYQDQDKKSNEGAGAKEVATKKPDSQMIPCAYCLKKCRGMIGLQQHEKKCETLLKLQ